MIQVKRFLVGWLVWLLGLPFITIYEVVYLVRHPRTFSWPAALVGLLLAGFSYLVLFTGGSPYVVYITQSAAVLLYYFIKLKR
jgi:hypothetical protein